MKPKKPQPHYDRPRQILPEEIIGDVMSFIRRQFYSDAEPRRWFQDADFLKREFVTWPANWLNSRGVTLPPQRYKSILMDVLMGVQRHGQTGVVKFWPGYLGKVIQDHFAHNGETYYEEGKSIRTVLERAMFGINNQVQVRRPDPVETLSQIHKILVHKRVSNRPCKTPAKQLSLL